MPPTTTRHTFAPGQIIFCLLAVLVGAVLRLSFPADIEYKDDEALNFAVSQGTSATDSWLGMPSGLGLPNPGLSVWVFKGLAWVSGATTPIELARAIQWLNVGALVLLAVFALRRESKVERETWAWALALACVNPIDVLLQRKIWAPSVFPLVTTLMLWCWWRRGRPSGAFGWGLLGGLLGQIQMAGFGFALAFAAVTFKFARGSVRWSSWALGSALAAVPLAPWLAYLWGHPTAISKTVGLSRAYVAFSWRTHPLTGWIDASPAQFALVWIVNALGLGLDYSLFAEIFAFLKYPVVGEAPTYAALAATLVILGLATVTISCAARRVVGLGRASFIGVASRPTSFGLAAAFLGFGALIVLTGYFTQRHYLLVTFPYAFVSVAVVTRFAIGESAARARAILAGLGVAQLVLSVTFLWYIHVNHGAPGGDYGVTYGAANREGENK